MKKLLHFLLFLSCVSNAQIVNIPDANFKAKLLQASPSNSIAAETYVIGSYPPVYVKIDTNNDGEIQVSEALNIHYLDLGGSDISDLTGIEQFVNLRYLNCLQNDLNTLNVSLNVNLLFLNCTNNQLSQLNVSNLVSLNTLSCGSNDLTQLNISNLINLKNLYCASNLLANLNISNIPGLLSLNCSSNQISSIDFTNSDNLNYLNLTSNIFTSIDLSELTNIKEVILDYNNISTLNVIGLANLEKISCKYNQMTSLILENLANLNELTCKQNQLSSLNLNNLSNLKFLYCNYNVMNSLTLSNCYNLIYLDCSVNQLTNVDFSTCINLQSITASQNLFYYLDFSKCVFKTHWQIGNQTYIIKSSFYSCPNLTYVNLKNGDLSNDSYYGFQSQAFSNCPNLNYICVDDAAELNLVSSFVNTNVVVNQYCSFTPGGNYNTITGSIIYDANANGCEVTDLPQRNIKIDINDGTNQGATFTNNSGNYKFYSDTGSFTITPNIENPAWFSVSPLTATIPFANDNNNSATQNFCITPNGIHPDLEVVIMPILPARPGFDAVYKIVYKNKGNQTLSGSINFQYNDTNLDFVSSTTIPNSQATGNLVWNYANLMPFESRSVNVTFNVNSPTETPAVNIGDVFSFIAIGNPVLGDETTSDNTFQFNQIVVGAFDPNDKTCLEGNMVSPIKIGEYLHYNINFENTGTFQAENVVINDVIDIEKFDINTLQVIDASHPVTTRVSGGKTEFIFENINLGASQKGNVVFKIKTKSNLVIGNSVSNKANIYFDYNFPIETNTATTTFQALSNLSFNKDNSIVIYPNPTNKVINIKCDTIIKSIELFDVQGRVLVTKIISENSEVLDISDKANGIYFLKITSDKGIKVEKLIKE